MAEKKYYWLKLERNFFKRHDIRIVEDMPNGKEYVLFFMKLLVESIDHEGELRFNSLIPYNDQMLATITNTNIDIVRSAITMFQSLRLLEIWDDKTIYISDTTKMLGFETEWAQKKREYREKMLQIEDNERTKKDNVRQEIDKEKELDIEIDKELEKELDKKKKKNSDRFAPPTQQDVQVYMMEIKAKDDSQRFIDYYTSNGWMVGRNKMKDWKATVRNWVSRNQFGKTKRTEAEIETYTDDEQMSQAEQDEIKNLLKNIKGAL
jgi:predicted phage replisome organizer